MADARMAFKDLGMLIDNSTHGGNTRQDHKAALSFGGNSNNRGHRADIEWQRPIKSLLGKTWKPLDKISKPSDRTASMSDVDADFESISDGDGRKPSVLRPLRQEHISMPEKMLGSRGSSTVLGTQGAAPTVTDEADLALQDPSVAEQTRVEKLLNSASSDFALWEILESDVFPMIARLQSAESKSSTKRKRKQRNSKSKSSTVTSTEEDKQREDQRHTGTAASTDTLPLHAVLPAYPLHLLLSLRRLSRGFSRPSPLALSLLPRIKACGPISYVLGATTPFYNELLYTLWTKYEDYSGMVDILTEMERAGVEMDEETVEVVGDCVAESQNRDGLVKVVSGLEMWKGKLRELSMWDRKLRGNMRTWYRGEL
jgi:hypothetical protein